MAPPRKVQSSPSVSPIASVIDNLVNSYQQTTPKRIKIIDAFLLFILLSGAVQFAYCVLITSFPFNAFLAGFAATVGQFVLTAALRSQVSPYSRLQFPAVSPERAFADFAVGSIVLHFFVYNFLG